MAEIYPSPQWNFVYGSASIDEEIGIYSFAQLDPLFLHSSPELSKKVGFQQEANWYENIKFIKFT